MQCMQWHLNSDGRVWAVTASGIVTIQLDNDGRNFYIRKWNDADGITPEDLHGANIVRDRPGKNLGPACGQGIYVFMPTGYRLQREVPEVVITNVQLRLQETRLETVCGFTAGIPADAIQPGVAGRHEQPGNIL